MDKRNHEDVKNMLKSVPGVKEHVSKVSIQKGKEILKRRVDLKLSQTEVVKMAQEKGIPLTQATISKAEGGHEGITNGTFDKIVDVLGGIEDCHLTFKEKRSERPKMAGQK